MLARFYFSELESFDDPPSVPGRRRRAAILTVFRFHPRASLYKLNITERLRLWRSTRKYVERTGNLAHRGGQKGPLRFLSVFFSTGSCVIKLSRPKAQGQGESVVINSPVVRRTSCSAHLLLQPANKLGPLLVRNRVVPLLSNTHTLWRRHPHCPQHFPQCPRHLGIVTSPCPGP